MNVKRREREHALFSIILVMTIFLAAIPAVSAFTATLVSPADPAGALHSGGVISIQINGLAAADQFKYKITSADLQTPGNTVTLTNVNMPFGFTDGTSLTTLTTTGVTPAGATLMVKRLSDATELQLTGATITSAKNIKKDNYDVSITGTKTGTDIGIDYSVAGTVSNPITNPSTLSFTLSNINTGHLTIEVLDGAASRLLQTFTITLPPPAPPAPIDAGSDEAPAAAAPAAPPAAPQALLAPPGVSATTVSLQQNEEGKVLAEYVIETDPAAGFSATVDITLGTTVVTATGQPVGEISITPLDPATVTEATVDQSGVFSFSGFSVECEPTGAQFSGGSVTISFSLTPAQWAEALGKVNGNTAAMTIQTYDPATKSWIDVPTTVDPVTHTVSAQITHFTTYALFYKIAKEVPTTSPPTFGDMVPAATMTTLAPGTTPVKTMLAPPSTTESPGLPGIVVIGVVGFVGFFVMKRRQ